MKKFILTVITSFFLLACSEDNNFMQHSDETMVIDIVQDSIFGNGEKIGSLSNDVYPNGHIIEPIQKLYHSKNPRPQNVHLRFNTGDSYNTLMEAVWTFAIETNRPENIQFVIGNNFKDSIKIEFFQQSKECRSNVVLKLLRHEKESEDEIQQREAMSEKCDRNYMETVLFFSDRKGRVNYTITGRKQPSQRFYTVDETLSAMEAIQNEVSAQEKLDKGKITFISQETVTMGQMAKILSALQKKNYHLSFGTGWIGK